MIKLITRPIRDAVRRWVREELALVQAEEYRQAEAHVESPSEPSRPRAESFRCGAGTARSRGRGLAEGKSSVPSGGLERTSSRTRCKSFAEGEPKSRRRISHLSRV